MSTLGKRWKVSEENKQRRKDSFKNEEFRNRYKVKHSFKDKESFRKMRSEVTKQTWLDGKMDDRVPGEYSHTLETFKKKSEISRRLWADPEYRKKTFKCFDTVPERIMEGNLLRSGFMVQKQFHVLGVGLVDFYLPEENIVIECDGDYWHGSDRPEQQRKDKIRTEKLQQLGYKVFRFWEHEIGSNMLLNI